MPIKTRSDLKTRLQRGSDVVSKKLGEDIYDSLVAEFERLKKEVLLRTGVQSNRNTASSATATGNYVTTDTFQTVNAEKIWKQRQDFQDGAEIRRLFANTSGADALLDLLAERDPETPQAAEQEVASLLARNYRYSSTVNRTGTALMRRLDFTPTDVNSRWRNRKIVGNGTASSSLADTGSITFLRLEINADFVRVWAIGAFGETTGYTDYAPTAMLLIGSETLRFRFQVTAQENSKTWKIGGDNAGSMVNLGSILANTTVGSTIDLVILRAFDKPVDGWSRFFAVFDGASVHTSGWIADSANSNLTVEAFTYPSVPYSNPGSNYVVAQDPEGLDPSIGEWACSAEVTDAQTFYGLSWAEGSAFASSLGTTILAADVAPLCSASTNWNADSTIVKVGRVDESDNETIDFEVDISGMVTVPRLTTYNLSVKAVGNTDFWNIDDVGNVSIVNENAVFSTLGAVEIAGRLQISGLTGTDDVDAITLLGGITNTTGGVRLHSVGSATPTRGELRANNAITAWWDETGFTADSLTTDHIHAETSAGITLKSYSGTDIALLGAGGGAGSTWYGQINGTSLQMSSLTSGRIVQAGASGLLQDDAGLTYSKLSSITRYLFLGDGSVAGTIAYVANGAAGQRRVISYQTGSSVRWVVGAENDAESGSNAGSAYFIEALTDAGAIIDKPVSIARASAGVITLGGTSARRVDLTGALSFSGTTRITNAGAATFTTVTSSALTSGRIPTVGTSGLLQDDAGLLYAQSSGVTIGITVGSGTSASTVAYVLNGAASQSKALIFRTAGSERWRITSDNSAESGGDAGSVFTIEAYTDLGVKIDNIVAVNRASGGTITIGGSSRRTDLTGALSFSGTTRITNAGAATFTSVTVSGLTSGRLPTIGTSGLLGNDAGWTYTQTSGVTTSVAVGDGAAAATAAFIADAASGQAAALSLRAAGTTRWSVARLATSIDFSIIARDASGVEIDTPINIVNASAGLITIGGTSARPVNLTGDLRFAGTTRITSAGAATFASITTAGVTASSVAGFLIEANSGTDVALFGAGGGAGTTFYGQINGTAIQLSSLTAGRLPTIGASGLIGNDAGWTFAQTASVTTSVTVGDGSAASDAGFLVNAPSTSSSLVALRSGTTTRWALSRLATSLDFALIALDASAVLIDYPINVVNASAGLITIGGTSARPVNLTGDLRFAGTTRVTSAGAATFASATISNLTANRIPTIGTSGLLGSDAGLTIVQSSGITVTVVLGDGSAASNTAFALRAPAARRRIIGFQTGTSDRWVIGADATAESGSNAGSALVVEAYTDAGAAIDTPVSIVRASAGLITIGGTSARRVDLTGALSFSGTTRITNAGAATFTSLTISGATSNQIPYIGAAALVTTDAGFTNATTGGITYAIVVGNGSVSSTVGYIANGAAGQIRAMIFRSGGSDRWRITATNAAESGSNAGSAFAIEAYTDAGSAIDTPVSIVRASAGLITIGGSSGRRVDLTGALSFSGTTRITNAGAATFTSVTATGLTIAALAASSSEYKLAMVDSSGAFSTDTGIYVFRTAGSTRRLVVGALSAGNSPVISFHTGAATGGLEFLTDSGSARFKLSHDTVTDALEIEAYNSSGVFVDNVLAIYRAAGDVAQWNRPVLNSSAIRWNQQTRSGSASTGANDIYIRYTGAGGHTETLPSATGSMRVLVFDNNGSGNWTIDGDSTDTIDGSATQVLSAGVKMRIVDVDFGEWRTI